MERITIGHLEKLLGRINQTSGKPHELDQAYGQIGLVRIVNDSGGCTNVIPFGSKRETYNAMRVYLQGIEITAEN